jgi:DNA transformation protein and related proteins
MSAISTIPNLGPASEAAFGKVGITTAEEIRAMGPDAAYARLLDGGTPPHFIGYYVLVMGLQGRPWNDCKGAEKAALRLRFDALKAQHGAGPLSPLETFMNDIGLIPAKR